MSERARELAKKTFRLATESRPKVMERVVQVASDDKNFRPENCGLVRVTIACDRAYWAAADRALRRPIWAGVVSGRLNERGRDG
jgi:hypothetical protein